MSHNPKDDTLHIKLSPHHSLDLVRFPESRKYRIVFTERLGVHHMSFVELNYETALAAAKFLAVLEDGMRPILTQDELEEATTNPGLPSNVLPKLHNSADVLLEAISDGDGLRREDGVPHPVQDDPVD
jgi:hypothetical protein